MIIVEKSKTAQNNIVSGCDLLDNSSEERISGLCYMENCTLCLKLYRLAQLADTYLLWK